MSADLTTATFTVRATLAQSERWKRCADAEGFRSAGTWLARAADAYLKVRARAGNPIPLAWRRGRFSVRLDGGELVAVNGHVSEPFGAFPGTGAGAATYPGRHRYVLTYLPDARIVATLRSFQQCKALASEMAPAILREDAAGIIERHRREAM